MPRLIAVWPYVSQSFQPWFLELIKVLQERGISAVKCGPGDWRSALQEDDLHGVLMPWDATLTPLLIDSVRRENSAKRNKLPVIVIADQDWLSTLRQDVANVAVLGPGTYPLLRQLEQDASEQARALAAMIMTRLEQYNAEDRSWLSLDKAHLYLFGVARLRGIHDAHQQRDRYGPLHVLQAAAGKVPAERLFAAHQRLTQKLTESESETKDAVERELLRDLIGKLQKDPPQKLAATTIGSTERTGKWLLIDDNPAWREILGLFTGSLEELQLSYNRPVEALVKNFSERLREETRKSEQPFDGIFLGVRLHRDDLHDSDVKSVEQARTLSGLQILTALREQDIATPVVVLTGSSNSFIATAVAELDGQYLRKPASLDEANEFIAQCRPILEAAQHLDELTRRELMRFLRSDRTLRMHHAELPHEHLADPLSDVLTLWGLAQSAPTAEATGALCRSALVMVGLAEEVIRNWMIDKGWARRPQSRRETYSLHEEHANKPSLRRLFDLLMAVRVVRNEAAHLKPRIQEFIDALKLLQDRRGSGSYALVFEPNKKPPQNTRLLADCVGALLVALTEASSA